MKKTSELAEKILVLCVEGDDILTDKELVARIKSEAVKCYEEIQSEIRGNEVRMNKFALGVLCDFIGFLTTRKTKLVLSDSHDPTRARIALDNFMKYRNVEITEPYWDWYEDCQKLL